VAFINIALFCVVIQDQFLFISKANILEHDIEKESLWTVEIYESCDYSTILDHKICISLHILGYSMTFPFIHKQMCSYPIPSHHSCLPDTKVKMKPKRQTFQHKYAYEAYYYKASFPIVLAYAITGHNCRVQQLHQTCLSTSEMHSFQR
jgi:hypothetical protein